MEISRFIRSKYLLFYGASLALLLFLLKWLESRLILINSRLDIYIGSIAVIFTALGIWLALKLLKPKVETIIIEKEIYLEREHFEPDQNQSENIGISKRELEVLQLMSQGLSNQEIAGQLFVSLSTVKTHSSKIFEKLDVKRRTQAIETAKRLKIIP